MIATEIFGGLGKLFTPVQNVKARYTYGIVKESQGLAQPFLIATNGKMTYEDMVKAKYTGILGQATVPVYTEPIEKGRPNIVAAMSKMDELIGFDEKGNVKSEISKLRQLMKVKHAAREVTGLESAKVKTRHLLTKVWPKLRPDGFTEFRDGTNHMIAVEASWFEHFVDEIQYFITMMIQPNVHGGFRPQIYGLGQIHIDAQIGIRVTEKPSVESVFENNKCRVEYISEDRTNNEKGYYWMYTYILARTLQFMCMKYKVVKNQGGKSMELDDYMAFACEIIASKAGYGENEYKTIYQGTDLTNAVRDEIGNGISEAYNWQNFDSEFVEDLLFFWIVKAIVCSRVKVPTMAARFKALFPSDKIRGAFDWLEATNAELPGLGGDSQPYLMMSSNKPKDKLYFPMALISEMTNHYERNLTRKLSLVSTDVVKGEIQGNPLEPTDTSEKFIQWKISNDARRWEIVYPWYQLYVWKLPISDFDIIVDDQDNIIVDMQYQMMMFMLSQMAQGNSIYSEGYFIHNNIKLYGSVSLPIVAGHPNPIQTGIGETREQAADPKNGLTVTPERISNTETSTATEPATTGEKPSITPPVAQETATAENKGTAPPTEASAKPAASESK
jgi:hypothetical protein